MLTIKLYRWVKRQQDSAQWMTLGAFGLILLSAILPIIPAFMAVLIAIDGLIWVIWKCNVWLWQRFVYLVGVPSRMRQQINAEKRRIAEEQKYERMGTETARTRLIEQNEAARRREARSQCELLFNLHEADINRRFNRQMLNDYMSRYMGDSEPSDVVERRAKELRALIEKHREAVGLGDRPKSIDQLARWFLEEKGRIEALPLDEDLREEHLAMLQIRYAELSQEILETARP